MPLSTLKRYAAVVYPGSQRVLPARDLRPAPPLPQPGRAPLHPAGQPVLPAGADRPAAQRDDADSTSTRAAPTAPTSRSRGSATTAAASRARGPRRTSPRPGATTSGCAGSSAGRGSARATASATRTPRATGSTRSSRRATTSSRPRRSCAGKFGVINAALVWSQAGRGEVARDRQLRLPAHGQGHDLEAARQRVAQARRLASSPPPLAARGLRLVVARARRTAGRRCGSRCRVMPTDARSREGRRPAVAERRARALRGPDPLLRARRRARPRRVVGAQAQDGLVWTFHLRKGLRWSDDRADHGRRTSAAPGCARSPRATHAALRAGPSSESSAARAATTRPARGDVGVEAVDDRTLRVTLQHPVPWLDQLVAYPVFVPGAAARRARTAGRSGSPRRAGGGSCSSGTSTTGTRPR